MFYVKEGIMPESRHTYTDRNNLLREELFGEESFDGPYSLLYHLNEPTDIVSVSYERRSVNVLEDGFRHRHLRASGIPVKQDFQSSMTPLMLNEDIEIGVAHFSGSTEVFRRSALMDELFFVHSGTGTLQSVFGDLRYSAGDYLYVPKGTTYRFQPQGENRFFYVRAASRIGVPPRYLNAYGQLKEGTPYYERDIRVPELREASKERGQFKVMVEYSDGYVIETRDRHPFDVVGWDGHLYPFAINVDRMAPIVGKLHQPPPVHETFSGKGFMVGTFLPRKFDFHPRAIPISYYHSNIDTDEVLFYSSGNFMSRRGIEAESITVHVRGLIHGPQPGAVEAAIGKEGTDEVAVMVEAYRPLRFTEQSAQIEDKDYMGSWHRR